MRFDGRRQRLGSSLALLVLGALGLGMALYLATSFVTAPDGQACGAVVRQVETSDSVPTERCSDTLTERSVWAFGFGMVGLVLFCAGVRRLNVIGEGLIPEAPPSPAGLAPIEGERSQR